MHWKKPWAVNREQMSNTREDEWPFQWSTFYIETRSLFPSWWFPSSVEVPPCPSALRIAPHLTAMFRRLRTSTLVNQITGFHLANRGVWAIVTPIRSKVIYGTAARYVWTRTHSALVKVSAQTLTLPIVSFWFEGIVTGGRRRLFQDEIETLKMFENLLNLFCAYNSLDSSASGWQASFAQLDCILGKDCVHLAWPSSSSKKSFSAGVS